MINETRDSFDSWVMDTYEELHSTLFDDSRKFRMNYMLSGEMFCYLLVKPWYKRVMNLEDIRQEVNEEQVRDVRGYLEDRSEDFRSFLVGWFFPRENESCSTLDFDLVTRIAACGMVECMRQTIDKNPGCTMDDVADILSERFQDYSFDFIEEMVWYAMDFVDRMNRDGKEVPEDLRAIARNLEAREDSTWLK
ncbi:hypothetical protein [Thermophilibacter provencensis]|uniref:hypothetical protein n=1 Tax=Thermophilibacter provencensis TaxID=1852386 RepID=UPI0023538076|nr:hypothetical protein [Thermophilibacter provencensis]